MEKIIKNIAKVVLPQSFRLHVKIALKRMENKKLLASTHKHYDELVQKLRQRPKNEKIRFGMYVVFDSSFGGYELVEILKQNADRFSLKIVIVPDSSRGEHHQKLAYEQTKSFFVNKYGEEYVLDGLVDGGYVDYSDEFDVIYCANPYDAMVPEVFRVQYLAKKNVLPIYIPYGYTNGNYSRDVIFPMMEQSLLWKIFACSKEEVGMYKKNQLLKGKNVVLSGYAKMDSIIKIEPKPRDKKRIIISPHHTVAMDSLPLSNFLEYSDFFLKLPKLYPEFDFIFRPHPLLFTAMVNAKFWTQGDVDSYINKLESLGIEYSKGGDYFDLFVNSDAMIHDCGSFLVEYLYMKKPCCYMLRFEKNKRKFSKYGKKCLESYWIAKNEDDIKNFLDNLKEKKTYVIPEKQCRFIEEEIMCNYPNASKSIFDCIYKELSS